MLQRIYQIIIYCAFIVVMALIINNFLHPLTYLAILRDKDRVHDLATIQKALQSYYNYHGRYPSSNDRYQLIGLENQAVAWGGNWSPYLGVMPKDPSSDRKYAYIAAPGLQAYFLYASLENPSDTENSCDGKCTNAPTGACGVHECNYGITSPNAKP